MKRTLTVLLVVIIGAGFGLVAFKADALKADAGNFGPGAKAAPLAAVDYVAANGVVEGKRPEVTLRPEVVGTIALLHARENQEVKKGDVLAELINETQKEQVALAQSDVDLARAQLERLRNGERPEKRKAVAALAQAKRAVYEQAESDAQRSQRLTGRGAASEQQYETDRARMLHARAELVQAEAERDLVEAPAQVDEVAAAQARIAAAEARLRLARAELAKTRLLAPSDGRVLQLYAEPGEMAGPASTQPILVLADLSKRRVRAFVEELDAARVAVGQRTLVTADGLPNKQFAGKVAVVLPRMGKRALETDAPGEYKDLYFREVIIELDQADELPLNLRVQTRISTAARAE